MRLRETLGGPPPILTYLSYVTVVYVTMQARMVHAGVLSRVAALLCHWRLDAGIVTAAARLVMTLIGEDDRGVPEGVKSGLSSMFWSAHHPFPNNPEVLDAVMGAAGVLDGPEGN